MLARVRSLLVLTTLLTSMATAQDTANDVKLLQSFFSDASIAGSAYFEGGFQFDDFNGFSILGLAGRGGIPINEQIEINAQLAFARVESDFRDASGLTDPIVAARVRVVDDKAKVAVGGFITLPAGDEDIFQGDFNLGGFGAIRYPAGPKTVLTGTAGLSFLESGNDRDVSLAIAGGIIQSINNRFSFVGELELETENSVGLLSAGFDYRLSSGPRFRGALGIGVDDGSPDLGLLLSILLSP